jgi:CCR4-NOT transcription complex subunit 4
MKNQVCPKNDCMYLHELGDPEASFTKEEMHQGKHQEYEKRLHDALIAQMQQQSQQPTTNSNPSTSPVSSGSTGNVNGSINNGVLKPSVENKDSSCGGNGNGQMQKEAWPSLSTSPVTVKENGKTGSKGSKKKKLELFFLLFICFFSTSKDIVFFCIFNIQLYNTVLRYKKMFVVF